MFEQNAGDQKPGEHEEQVYSAPSRVIDGPHCRLQATYRTELRKVVDHHCQDGQSPHTAELRNVGPNLAELVCWQVETSGSLIHY